MPSISGPSITSSGRAGALPGLLRVLDDEGVDPLDQRVRQPALHLPLAPREIVTGALLARLSRVARRDLQQPVRRVWPPVQDHVLDPLPQLGLDVVVHGQHARIDDRHVEAGGDRVVQEDAVDRLADRVVAAEREAHIRHAAGRPHTRQLRLEAPDALEERVGVVRVLLDARRDGEDVRVEDDVLVREADLLGEQPMCALENVKPPAYGVSLAPFVERHHDDARAVALTEPRLAQELLLALLERDRVHDAAPLELLQAGFEHRPLGAVDHHGHGRDVRLGGDAAEEPGHRGDAIEHRLVHVHVDELRAVRDLLARDVDRLILLVIGDEAGELA